MVNIQESPFRASSLGRKAAAQADVSLAGFYALPATAALQVTASTWAYIEP